MGVQQGEQHYVAQSHFRRFFSGKTGDGMFVIYDKTSPPYRHGLPRKIKGGRFERRPHRALATYDTHHAQDAELRMARIESDMNKEWNRVSNEKGVFGPELIPAIIRYMGLSEMRRPDAIREFGFAVRFKHGIVFSDETVRALISQGEQLTILHEAIAALPCWKVHTLDADSDDEYILGDRPAVVGFGGRDFVACEQSLAFMPMSKKQLLVGFWNEAVIEPFTFDADPVNGMLFCKAAKEIYSHRVLDPEKVKQWVNMEPAIRLVSNPNVRLVKMG